MSERVKRLLVNSALFGVASFAGAVYGSEGPITAALAIAGVLAAARAFLGGIAVVAGWVTPGNPIVVNVALAFVGAFAGALIEGGITSRAALFAAAYAGARAVAGLFVEVSDHPGEVPVD
jgi:hypothetical protein